MTGFRGLTTERRDLPPLTSEHTAALAEIHSDPDVARYIGGDRLTAEVIPLQVAAFADEWDERGYGQSAVIERQTGAFVGRIGLHFWPDWNEIELGYILAGSAQGKGLAAEGARAWIDWAKSEAHIDHLIANIHPENQASIGLAKRLGFVFDRDDTTPSGLPTLIFRLPVAT
ncbi:GNAT family N-acetyltransferase [Nocardioides plantarum]|uniref:GNAT family N-acetyltransferase n=1 Tax=Nocardioides plantarum TaxID=29299 RepID=A0ABV5K646_9ACTN|nr:GNAT family N-acetyltransferase [Nocardioides plantarum]